MGGGLTHAKTCPRADRGGDTWTISTRQAGVNHPGFAAMSRDGRADSIRPFEPSDIDLVERTLGRELAQKAFWDNPLALYRVKIATTG